MPSASPSALPAMISAAAAFKHGDVAEGPRSPCSRSWIAAAFVAASPPLSAAMSLRARPGVFRRYIKSVNVAVLEFGDVRHARRRQLVQAVVAMHDPHVHGAQFAQHLCDRLRPAAIINAERPAA